MTSRTDSRVQGLTTASIMDGYESPASKTTATAEAGTLSSTVGSRSPTVVLRVEGVSSVTSSLATVRELVQRELLQDMLRQL